MDISNMTLTGSVTTSVTKGAGVTGPGKLAPQGNSLPDLGQFHVQAETPQSSDPLLPLNSNELKNLVDISNKALQGRSSNLKFTVAEGTDINVVRIEDSQTGELIRQFPSEAMIAIARAIEEMQQGVMLEEKA